MPQWMPDMSQADKLLAKGLISKEQYDKMSAQTPTQEFVGEIDTGSPKPIPALTKAKGKIDDAIQENVVNPMYRAGHTTAGPLTGAVLQGVNEMVFPETGFDFMPGMGSVRDVSKLKKAIGGAENVRMLKPEREMSEAFDSVRAAKGGRLPTAKKPAIPDPIDDEVLEPILLRQTQFTDYFGHDPVKGGSVSIDGTEYVVKNSYGDDVELHPFIEKPKSIKPKAPKKPKLGDPNDPFAAIPDYYRARSNDSEQVEAGKLGMNKTLEMLEKNGHDEPYFGRGYDQVLFSDVKAVNHVGQMATPKLNDIKGHIGKNVAKGGADPFAWIDSKLGLSKKILADHADKPLKISTRSDLIAHDDYMEYLKPGKHEVNLHVLSDNSRFHRVLAPGAPSFDRAIKAAEKLHAAGIKVNIVVDKIAGLKPQYNSINVLEMRKRGFGVQFNHVTPSKKAQKTIEQVLGDQAFQSSQSQNFWQRIKDEPDGE